MSANLTVRWTPDTREVKDILGLTAFLGELEPAHTKTVTLSFTDEAGSEVCSHKYLITHKTNGSYDFNRVDGARRLWEFFNFIGWRNKTSRRLNRFVNAPPGDAFPGLKRKGPTCFLIAALKQVMLQCPEELDRDHLKNKSVEFQALFDAFAGLLAECRAFKRGRKNKPEVDRLYRQFYKKLVTYARTVPNKKGLSPDEKEYINLMKKLFIDQAGEQQSADAVAPFLLTLANMVTHNRALTLCTRTHFDSDSEVPRYKYKYEQVPHACYPLDIHKAGEDLTVQLACTEKVPFVSEGKDKFATNIISNPNPGQLETINLFCPVLSYANSRGDAKKKVAEGRKLIPDTDSFTVKILKSTDNGREEYEEVMFRISSVVVHRGPSANCGHYYTLERASDNTWIKHDDNHISRVRTGLKAHLMQGIHNEVPRMIVLERVKGEANDTADGE